MTWALCVACHNWTEESRPVIMERGWVGGHKVEKLIRNVTAVGARPVPNLPAEVGAEGIMSAE